MLCLWMEMFPSGIIVGPIVAMGVLATWLLSKAEFPLDINEVASYEERRRLENPFSWSVIGEPAAAYVIVEQQSWPTEQKPR